MLGFETVKGKVLYNNLEIQEASFQKHVQKIVEPKGLSLAELKAENNLAVLTLRALNASVETLASRLKILFEGVRFNLIILDPLYKLLGKRKENAAENMTDLLGFGYGEHGQGSSNSLSLTPLKELP